jgi:hypothetical protein
VNEFFSHEGTPLNGVKIYKNPKGFSDFIERKVHWKDKSFLNAYFLCKHKKNSMVSTHKVVAI